VDVTNSGPRGAAWWMAWPAWCSSCWRVLGWSAGSGFALHGGARRCRGQQPRAAPPFSPPEWLTAAAIAIVSSDTTTHASCFGAGLLRIAPCLSNTCCWSLSSHVPTEGGHVRWNTMSSAACCMIYGEKLRGGPPTPVSHLAQSRVSLRRCRTGLAASGPEAQALSPAQPSLRLPLGRAKTCIQYHSIQGPDRTFTQICVTIYANI
jgi:hypothetical protein